MPVFQLSKTRALPHICILVAQVVTLQHPAGGHRAPGVPDGKSARSPSHILIAIFFIKFS